MLYIWRTPNDYPKKLMGVYGLKNSPNSYIFTNGKKLEASVAKPFIKFSCDTEDLKQYDSLVNSSRLPIINKKLCDIFDRICNEDVQYFDVVLECKDGFLESYKILNITHAIKAIDHKQSRCSIIAGTENEILGFDFLAYNLNALSKSGYEIARDAEYDPHILVGEKLFSEFKKNNIKGVRLMTVDEFNATGH